MNDERPDGLMSGIGGTRLGRIKDFWNRWKVQILCVAGGFLIYGILAGLGVVPDEVSDGYLQRGDYGSGATAYEFMVEGLTEEPVLCRTEIPARQYTDAEADQIFGGILDTLPDRIRGENESLMRVETDLVLPTSFEYGGITADWHSDAPEILDSYGVIQTENCPEEGAGVWLTAELSDGTHRAERVYAVTVYPKTQTEEERLRAAIGKEIQRESDRTLTGAAVKLPETYEGRKLRYYQEKEGYEMIPFLGILLAVLFYLRERNRGTEERKRRERELQADYADVVYQLMVFIGAGLTVSRAWERIVRNYEERRSEGRMAIRAAYEEMADAQAQMECGMPEGQAIVRFGQRCRLAPYRKLSSLLEQNRRAGTKNLTELLSKEMEAAWEQQKTTARRLGEEAGTKLMLPLMLMLVVVMVIILVPALFSMG